MEKIGKERDRKAGTQKITGCPGQKNTGTALSSPA